MNEEEQSGDRVSEKQAYVKPEITELGDWQSVTQQPTVLSPTNMFRDLFRGG